MKLFFSKRRIGGPFGEKRFCRLILRVFWLDLVTLYKLRLNRFKKHGSQSVYFFSNRHPECSQLRWVIKFVLVEERWVIITLL